MYKVSVIVPIYNTSKYLEKCVDSLINQTMNEIEIILVNDGSTDDSQNIIDKYVSKYPDKVKCITQQNSGQGSARNKGLDIASGEYIAFVDSDDYVENNTYENVYNYAIKKDLDIVCFKFWEVIDNNKTKKDYIFDFKYENKIRKYIANETSPWNKIIKKELLDRNNIRFSEDRIYEDLEIIPTLVLYTNKIDFIDEYYYNYVIRQNSTMRQKAYNKKLKDIYGVMTSLFNDLGNQSYKTELEFLHIEHLIHGAGLRFLEYEESKKDFDKIHKIMKKNFPKWRKNYYYKQTDKKYKIVCNLIYYKQIWLLKKMLKKNKTN